MVLLSTLDPILIDCAILLAGAVCLVIRPSVIAVMLLTGYQGWGLFVNGLAFLDATRGTDVHTALLAHLVLRVAAIVLMVRGLMSVYNQPLRPADDPRYADALRVVYAAVEQLGAAAGTDPLAIRSAFEAGVVHLVAAGVPEEEARTNLRRLVEADAGKSAGEAEGLRG
jgi:hypothetical protein